MKSKYKVGRGHLVARGRNTGVMLKPKNPVLCINRYGLFEWAFMVNKIWALLVIRIQYTKSQKPCQRNRLNRATILPSEPASRSARLIQAMEGVGARLGRSSARYGPTTVFTGPVRKWKKKWVPITPTPSNSNHHNVAAAAAGNRAVNGSNASPHLSLYQWTPITPIQNKDNGNCNGNVDSKNSDKDDTVAVEEQPKKKFKYIPATVLEEQKNESCELVEDETMPFETDSVEATSKGDEYNEKPDINDVPIDENQALQNTSLERHDLNESTLDLSLG